MVVADVGNALFGASDLLIRHRTEFLGPAYYASMGFAVPAALGAQMARARSAPGGAGGRWRFPDDRHGDFDHRALRPQPGDHRAQQRRLRHRAAHS